jgi:hypothetical protein
LGLSEMDDKEKRGEAGPMGPFDSQRHEVVSKVEGSPIGANLGPSRRNPSAPKITPSDRTKKRTETPT